MIQATVKTELGEIFIVEAPAEYKYKIHRTMSSAGNSGNPAIWTDLISEETDETKGHYKFIAHLGYIGGSARIIGQSSMLMTANIEEGDESKIIIVLTK